MRVGQSSKFVHDASIRSLTQRPVNGVRVRGENKCVEPETIDDGRTRDRAKGRASMSMKRDVFRWTYLRLQHVNHGHDRLEKDDSVEPHRPAETDRRSTRFTHHATN